MFSAGEKDSPWLCDTPDKHSRVTWTYYIGYGNSTDMKFTPEDVSMIGSRLSPEFAFHTWKNAEGDSPLRCVHNNTEIRSVQAPFLPEMFLLYFYLFIWVRALSPVASHTWSPRHRACTPWCRWAQGSAGCPSGPAHWTDLQTPALYRTPGSPWWPHTRNNITLKVDVLNMSRK